MIPILITLVAGLLPTYIIRFSILGIPTNLFEAAVWGVFVLTLLIPIARKQIFDTVRILPGPMKLFVCLFITSAVISTFYSPVLRSSLGILKGWIITPLVFGLLIRSLAPADENVRKSIIRSLVLSGVVVALLGLFQIHGFNRIASIYDVPNSLALFLVPVFFIAIGTGIQNKDRLNLLFSLVMLAAIIATQSFGAIIALVGTGLLAWILTSRRTSPSPSFVRRGNARSLPLTKGELEGVSSRVKSIFFVTFLLVVFLIFALSGRIQYLLSPLTHPNTTNSATVRLQLWDIGIRLIQKHPMLGIGLGQFEPAYQAELHTLIAEQANEANAARSFRLQPEYVFRDPHNWLLSFWLNLGLLGLLSFIALNYLAFKPYKQSNQHAFTLALVSMLIFGLVDTIYWKNDLSGLWWMLLFYVENAVANCEKDIFSV